MLAAAQCGCSRRLSGEREVLGVFALAALERPVEAVGLLDHVERELLVLPRVIVAELVLRFAVRLLVVPEPDADLVQLPRELSAYINPSSGPPLPQPTCPPFRACRLPIRPCPHCSFLT